MIIGEPRRKENCTLTYDYFRKNKELYKNDDVKYADYLKDKSIIIVGPASYLEDIKQGELIDSYDIVVRINKSFPVKEEHYKSIGEKTDILYHCLLQDEMNCGVLDYESIIEKGVEYISTPYPNNMNPFYNNFVDFLEQIKIYGNKIKYHFMNRDFYTNVVSELGTRPNSGIAAVLDLMRYEPKEVKLIGFTFFKTPFINGYRKIDGFVDGMWQKFDSDFRGNHMQIHQMKMIKMLHEDGGLKLDDVMKDILSDVKK